MTDDGATERIALQRAVAVITATTISVRPARAGVVVPLVQAGLAGLATWALVAFIDRLALWALAVLLVFVMVAGPMAVLGLVYQVAGTSFLMERPKGTARWQQGFLGLGLGTRELTLFDRVQAIEVAGDFDEELASGDLQDVVRWVVRLVKDSGRATDVGAVAAARPLAEEALERANALAEALAEMAGVEVRLGALPAWALLDDDDEFDEDEDEREVPLA